CIEKLKDNGKSAFYDLRHQTIYETLVEMFNARQAVDLITVQQHLKDRQLLDQVGGIAYLSQLQDAVPSAANLSYYLDIVREKHELRRMVQTCTDVVGRIYDYTGTLDELKFSVQSELGDIFANGTGHSDALTVRSPDELLAMLFDDSDRIL